MLSKTDFQQITLTRCFAVTVSRTKIYCQHLTLNLSAAALPNASYSMIKLSLTLIHLMI